MYSVKTPGCLYVRRSQSSGSSSWSGAADLPNAGPECIVPKSAMFMSFGAEHGVPQRSAPRTSHLCSSLLTINCSRAYLCARMGTWDQEHIVGNMSAFLHVLLNLRHMLSEGGHALAQIALCGRWSTCGESSGDSLLSSLHHISEHLPPVFLMMPSLMQVMPMLTWSHVSRAS